MVQYRLELARSCVRDVPIRHLNLASAIRPHTGFIYIPGLAIKIDRANPGLGSIQRGVLSALQMICMVNIEDKPAPRSQMLDNFAQAVTERLICEQTVERVIGCDNDVKLLPQIEFGHISEEHRDAALLRPQQGAFIDIDTDDVVPGRDQFTSYAPLPATQFQYAPDICTAVDIETDVALVSGMESGVELRRITIGGHH